MTATSFSAPEPISKDIIYEVLTWPGPSGTEHLAPLQGVLITPKNRVNPPMIVVPHGGPHSVYDTKYIPSYAFLCGYGGYAILYVNYRGSMGFGQDAIESLPGNAGQLDVEDVVYATRKVAASGKVDQERIAICGGSHGGFLTTHCIGQYPELFRAAATRNPVTNIASMVTATDIPDWCYVEGLGMKYDWTKFRPPTQEEISSMWAASPVAHIHRVRTPTLVALGMSDQRVPPSQGLEYYYSLRSMGLDTKLLVYESDDHAIDRVMSEADHWVNVKQWFDKYL
eukprot:CAMPEP_0118698622 /NCGR_PEP_ID=MMETSP0800-20121206/15324_1 /TAXON_ID=210618 ORGANISM="Striatella unipunctata, Strain CCMP2910" /NCGR_SAMPLE_ID=MMETSP0800 /ASSEMBLY_ACC=CAM_ASM_000638 /LENGTH=282 /DNA_ID=CAMNT_0006598505 /DNA_START=33 /DNA_END=881 /DNA_ORIENTATION=-